MRASALTPAGLPAAVYLAPLGSKPTTDGEVRQLQGFDQGLYRWQGGAHRGMVKVGWVGKLVSYGVMELWSYGVSKAGS